MIRCITVEPVDDIVPSSGGRVVVGRLESVVDVVLDLVTVEVNNGVEDVTFANLEGVVDLAGELFHLGLPGAAVLPLSDVLIPPCSERIVESPVVLVGK